MKKTFRLLSAMALMILAGSALASDKSNLSKAMKSGKDVYCNSIRDSDLKNYCQGVVKKQSIYCNNIRASSLKKECKENSKK